MVFELHELAEHRLVVVFGHALAHSFEGSAYLQLDAGIIDIALYQCGSLEGQGVLYIDVTLDPAPYVKTAVP